MFGKLTRKVESWQPVNLLCKRFNVPEPLGGYVIASLFTLFFLYLKCKVIEYISFLDVFYWMSLTKNHLVILCLIILNHR